MMMIKQIINWGLAAIMFCCVGVFSSCTSNDDNQTAGGVEKRDRARYTVIIYGNAGGGMDYIIEGMWDSIKPMLDDSTNVRVFVMYKYGKASEDFSGKYGKPTDLVQFELNSKTDLNKLHETSAVSVPEYQLFDSKALAAYINTVKEYAPADNYVFALWGHGGGYDVISDRPDNMVTRAMLYDETQHDQAMSMYQFADALATCGNMHFQLIMFHNCLLGNIETLTEVQQYADYFWASTHSLPSLGHPITVMIDKLKNSADDNFEDRAKEMFVDLSRIYSNREGIPEKDAKDMSKVNMDFKVIRSEDLTALNNNISFFITRLLELYPHLSPEVMQQAMTACAYSYDVTLVPYLIDLRQYIQTVAAGINDSELKAHAKNAIECMDRSVVARWDEAQDFSKLQQFYLSVVLPYHDFLHYTTQSNYTVAESYYPSAFNRRTGWARWMDTNTYFPTKWMFNTSDIPDDADLTDEFFFRIMDENNKKGQQE